MKNDLLLNPYKEDIEEESAYRSFYQAIYNKDRISENYLKLKAISEKQGNLAYTVSEISELGRIAYELSMQELTLAINDFNKSENGKLESILSRQKIIEEALEVARGNEIGEIKKAQEEVDSTKEVLIQYLINKGQDTIMEDGNIVKKTGKKVINKYNQYQLKKRVQSNVIGSEERFRNILKKKSMVPNIQINPKDDTLIIPISECALINFIDKNKDHLNCMSGDEENKLKLNNPDLKKIYSEKLESRNRGNFSITLEHILKTLAFGVALTAIPMLFSQLIFHSPSIIFSSISGGLGMISIAKSQRNSYKEKCGKMKEIRELITEAKNKQLIPTLKSRSIVKFNNGYSSSYIGYNGNH